MERRYLFPGEYHTTQKPIIYGTLLGSCVSICIYNKKNHTSGMNHFLLATSKSQEEMLQNPGRYGRTSCEKIIQSLLNLDPAPRNYDVRIYGGANVTSHLNFNYAVGQHNIRIAEEILQKYGLRVIERDTGGARGRKITFDASTNTVTWQYIGTPRKEIANHSPREQVKKNCGC